MSYIILFSIVLLVRGCLAADQTITDRAIGGDVVQAVVDLITQSCIFDDDRLLLRRIAYAETQDGAATYTFSRDGAAFYGGIWQVTEADFMVTKSNSTSVIYGQINATFGIDWKTVQYTDLVKPLYSGLAARLKIDIYYKSINLDIPQSVQAQASFWALHYTTNAWGNSTVTINVFVSASNSIAETCSSPKADIVFVLDGSGSIGASNFANVRLFVVNVVKSFDISQQGVRIGLIEFSSSAVTEFNLTTYSTSQDVQTAVMNIPYFDSSTNSASAIAALSTMIQQQGRQANGVPVIAIFMTDGRSNDPVATAAAARNLHSQMPEVTVFAVGVGSNVDTNELDVIASTPSCLHVFQLSSFDDVTSFTNQILDQACKVPAQIESSDTISGSLSQNQYYYFKVTVHKQKKGIKVQIKTSSGGVKTYFSWKVHNPSSALYDYVSEADDTMASGTDLSIPWNDDLNSNSNRRRRSVDDVNGTVYGAIVGVQPKSNQFQLSYVDADAASSGSYTMTGCVLLGLATILSVAFQ